MFGGNCKRLSLPHGGVGVSLPRFDSGESGGKFLGPNRRRPLARRFHALVLIQASQSVWGLSDGIHSSRFKRSSAGSTGRGQGIACYRSSTNTDDCLQRAPARNSIGMEPRRQRLIPQEGLRRQRSKHVLGMWLGMMVLDHRENCGPDCHPKAAR